MQPARGGDYASSRKVRSRYAVVQAVGGIPLLYIHTSHCSYCNAIGAAAINQLGKCYVQINGYELSSNRLVSAALVDFSSGMRVILADLNFALDRLRLCYSQIYPDCRARR